MVAQQLVPDILTMFDQFTVSSIVAGKCATPDMDKLAKFVMNYQRVSGQAMTEIRQTTPDVSPYQVNTTLIDRFAVAGKSASAILDEEPCDGPRVREALRRFDVQASMNISAGPLP